MLILSGLVFLHSIDEEFDNWQAKKSILSDNITKSQNKEEKVKKGEEKTQAFLDQKMKKQVV